MNTVSLMSILCFILSLFAVTVSGTSLPPIAEGEFENDEAAFYSTDVPEHSRRLGTHGFDKMAVIVAGIALVTLLWVSKRYSR
jgi:hypothetical protein